MNLPLGASAAVNSVNGTGFASAFTVQSTVALSMMLPDDVFQLPPPPCRAIKLGVIGLGWVFNSCHARAIGILRANGWQLEVSALCDPSSSRLEAARLVFPLASCHPRGEDLMGHPGLDGVLILTPPGVALTLLNLAVERRLAAFVEKPVAQEAESLLRSDAAARANKVAVQVGYNRRYQPLYSEFQKQVSGSPGPTVLKSKFWRTNRTKPDFFADTLVHPMELILGAMGPMFIEGLRVLPAATAGSTQIDQGWRIDLRSAGDERLTAEIDIRPAVGCNVETYEVIGHQQVTTLKYPHSAPAVASLTRAGAGGQQILHHADVASDAADQLLLYSGFVHQMAEFCLLVAGQMAAPRCGLREASETLALFNAVTQLRAQQHHLSNIK
jgi:predicted dehydrogenase